MIMANPMMLMMGVSVLIMFGMPKLLGKCNSYSMLTIINGSTVLTYS